VDPDRQDVLRQPAGRLRVRDGRRAVPHHRGVHAAAEHAAEPATTGAAVSAPSTASGRTSSALPAGPRGASGAAGDSARSPWPARAAIGAGILLAVLAQLLPFYITVTSAMKARSDLSSQWLPPLGGIHWQNFATAVEQGGILRAIGNSAIVTLGATVLVCVLGALAAYPLARRPTLVNKLVLAGIIGLIMIPPLSILVPLYAQMVQLGGINTYWGTILVMTATQLPLAIFL